MRIVDSVRSSTVKYHPGTRHIFSLAIHHRFPNPNQDILHSDSGVQGRELAHTLLRSQITLWWNYQRSPSTSNLTPSRQDQPLLVSGTKRAAAKPHWLVARRGSINTAQGF